MNLKKTLLTISSLTCVGFITTSCSFFNHYSHYEYIEEKASNTEDEVFQDGAYTRYASYASYIAKNAGLQDVNLGSTASVMRNNAGKRLMNTTGDQKMLVIPVDFEDFTCHDLGTRENEFVDDLNKVFFGVEKNNLYVSVAEYYNRSSYGKLRLDGKVVDKFYRFPKTVAEIKENKLDNQTIINCYDEIIEWYKENYDDIDDFKISGLDGDKNIPIYLVYTYPIELSEDNQDFFWAYTFSSAPLSWSSYSFAKSQFKDLDAHTYIHEVGHLFGLNDYYPTLKFDGNLSPDPAGRIDMMDCSIGDHTAFSKMFMDWVKPYYLTSKNDNEFEITLNSFTETGDLILINDYWNKSVFDEYYLIEFYTPTGLNTYDTSIGNSEAKLPNLPGIKLYHVDARLAYYEQGRAGITLSEYCDLGKVNPGKNNVTFAHDNNTYFGSDLSKFQKNYLYQLVLNNTNQMISGCARNGHIYHAGDIINGLRLNTNHDLKYSISIESITYKEAKLKITKS